MLYEKTKHMTAEEHTRWSNERAQRLAAQYGFKIGKPSGKQRESQQTRHEANTVLR
jgi:hypothetical protein